MTPFRRVSELISIGDKIFVLTAIGQAITLILIVFVAASCVIYQSEKSNNRKVVEIFSKWEPAITEGVYVFETFGSFKLKDLGALNEFRDSLRASGVDSEVSVGLCTQKAEKFFSAKNWI